MTAALGAPLLITNPRHGRGRSDVLTRLVTELRRRGAAPDVVVSRWPGHATDLAREAVAREGRGYVVAVGGDGTIHEVLNGIVDAEAGVVRGTDPVLGAVSAGTGCDLLRTFGLDRDPEVLADHLVTDATVPFDVGRARLTGPDGHPTTRVFANIAEVGYGGDVVRLANRLPRWLGTARYALGIVGAVGRFRLAHTRVDLDQAAFDDALSNVVVANGQFFGGGLRVAPRALPSDGRFNVQVWQGRPVDVVRGGRQLRTGAHLGRADVREWQSAGVTVDGERALTVEADGEVLGFSPARFDLLPGLLRFKL